MRNIIKIGALALLVLACGTDAFAQQTVQPVVVNGQTGTGAYTTCTVGTVATNTCPLPVSGTFTPAPGTQDVNLKQVGGVTTLTGAGAVGPGSARVAVGQDTTTVAGAAPTTTGIYVTGPSAAALSTAALQSSVGSTAHTDAVKTGASIGTNNATAPGSSTQIGTQDLSGNLQAASASNPVPVTAPSVSATGTVTTVNQTVTVSTVNAATVGVEVSADTNVTLTPQAEVNAVWVNILAFPVGTNGVGVATIASNGSWTIPTGGFSNVRLLVTVAGATPTATVVLNATRAANLNQTVQALQSSESGNVQIAPGTGTNGQQLAIALDPQGGQIQADETRIVPVSCTSACGSTTLFSIDTWGYQSIAVDVDSVGSSTTTFQVSNDNSTWTSDRCVSQAAVGTGISAGSTTTTTGIFVCDTKAKYFRPQITAYASGTVTEGAVLRAAPFVPYVSTMNVSQAGAWTVQPGNTPNTTAWLVNPALDYPSGATPITASATGTTAATTATLAGTSGKTTYICSFSIRANATAAATGNATITGTITGTLNYTQWTAPNASGLGITEPPIGPHCIPASGTNTGISVISAAPGTGGVVSVSATGYQQ